ncbi:MAG: hypothetical protein ACRDZ8_18835 [Acidimicrobiales bacterium]
MKWSVGLEAEAGREMTREEIVELADAVAEWSGVASGIGSNFYGATLLVEAHDRDGAVARATEAFREAAARAGLAAGAIVRVEVADESDDEGDMLGGLTAENDLR